MPKKLETEDYTVVGPRRIAGRMRQAGDTVALTAGTAAHLVASGAVKPKAAAATPPASPAAPATKA